MLASKQRIYQVINWPINLFMFKYIVHFGPQVELQEKDDCSTVLEIEHWSYGPSVP